MTRNDSSRIVLRRPEIVGDTLYGAQRDGRAAVWSARPGVALTDVSEVAVRRVNVVRTAVLAFAALLALLGWGVAAAAPDYSPDHQQRFTLEHVTEFPSRKSHWSVLNDGARLPKSYERLADWHGGKLSFSDRMRAIARDHAPVADSSAVRMKEMSC